MLLRIAKALMSAVNVEAALRSIYQNLSSLNPDGVLLISNRGAATVVTTSILPERKNSWK